MSLLHEKRAAPTKATLLPTAARKNRPKITIPVNSDTTRKPRSEIFSVTLDGWSLFSLLLANAAVVISAAAVIAGGQGV